MLLIAPSFDVLAGKLAITAWFFAFAIVMLTAAWRSPGPARTVFRYGGIASVAAGLLLTFFWPSSAYLLKLVVMLVLSACVGAIGLKYGPRRYAWFALVAAVMACAAVSFQYVLMETAR